MPDGARDKYGTGFSSIHQREAPDKGKHLAWNSSAGTTFRAAAQRAIASVLLQACCTRHRVGAFPQILFVGDSQLQAISEHLCDPSKRRLVKAKPDAWPASASSCLTTSTLLVFVVSAGKWARHFPSFHTATVALSRLPTGGMPLPTIPTALVTNFASPHLLHVHPVRPFFDADSSARPRCYPQSTCADYRGLRALETWMTSDLATYRRVFGPHSRQVIMTPNWVCDAKIYPSYTKQLSRPVRTRFASCRQWVLARQQQTALSEDEADTLCSTFTFTGAGSSNMSALMATIAARSNASLDVRLLDATALTRERCDSTEDARHYPKLVPAQALALERLLA